MTVTLLDQRREKRERDQSLESRVSALENYIAMLIGTGEIADGAITTPKILNGAVAELKIAAGAVTATKTAVAGINSSTGNVSANHIIAGMIQSGAITTPKIYAGAVTADKITVSTLSAISANIGSITAGTITGITITGGTLQTSVSGQRVVINSDVIKLYDENGLQTGQLEGYNGNMFFNANNAIFSGNVHCSGGLRASADSFFAADIGFITSQEIRWYDGVGDYILRHDGSNFTFNDGVTATGPGSFAGLTCNGNIQPNATASLRYCGTSGAYWARVYSDAYFTKNTTFQTFDKYDDLQILRDLKFDKKDRLVLKNLPKEIHDKGFINFGGMTSFNLCASRKIVECVDDLKSEIDKLKLKLTKLERQVI